ncbi:MAG TPA: hypothetical protein VFK57_20430 [Vicinamibacterales bacterium]|nr:hypothetical protein [Vicinamibacterales bacterium]
MTCRDLRHLADVFLSAETAPETNHDILRHVDMCASCRADLDGRRRVRTALRRAFTTAPALAPPLEFTADLRRHLLEDARRDQPWPMSRRSWLGLAAGLVLTAGLTGRLMTDSADSSVDALVRDALGDHRNCALQHRLTRMPVPLPEAAAEFDEAYRLLMTAPPDEVSAPGGRIRVRGRHACAYDGRRFGHVIMQYRDHTVSLLMTARSSRAGAGVREDAIPHLVGGPASGLSVVSVDASGRSILLVGDLEGAELTNLSRIVVTPLAQRLMGAVLPSAVTRIAAR